MKKWLWRIALLSMVLIAGVLAVGHWLAPLRVAVTTPVRGEAVQAVYATGTVEASNTSRIAPQLPGKLVALLADEGNKVQAGQVLARLDDADLRATLSGLLAKAAYAEQQLRRLQPLADKSYVSSDQMDQARSALLAAQADVQHVQEQIRFMTLTAPASGLVIRRDGEVGDFIPANQPVFYLARAHLPLRIDTDVDEEDITQVRPGQEVLIHADAFPGQTFTGHVTDITPKGDPVARSYRVRVGLPANSPLLIGMTAETNIIIARRANALLIPSSALNGNAVWLLAAGRAQTRQVVIGAKGSERTEILQGLGMTDQVLVQPPAGLKAGRRVQAAPAAAAHSGAAS